MERHRAWRSKSTVAAIFAVFCITMFHTTSSAHEANRIPEPTITYKPTDTGAIPVSATGEHLLPIDEARKQLHEQHHAHTPIETRKLPAMFEAPAMKSVSDFAVPKSELVVINPGPGEYVNVMEGQRHGYNNLTVGITYTAPGGAPPMHTHLGEESHVLLEGHILYALGDSIFTIQAPYIVNIPPMVPHCFMNLGDEVAELVVIFPTNVWEYDVLNHFPFKGLDIEKAKQGIVKR